MLRGEGTSEPQNAPVQMLAKAPTGPVASQPTSSDQHLLLLVAVGHQMAAQVDTVALRSGLAVLKRVEGVGGIGHV